MDEKVCLDTDVCIEILKNTEKGKKAQLAIDQREIYLASITVFELFLRKSNLFHVEMFLQGTTVIDFNELAAKKASDIFKVAKESGMPIDMRDLFIASTAMVNNCALATLNEKHYVHVAGLKKVVVS